MYELQLTILEKKDLESRYHHLKNTQEAHLTDEAIAKGYSIAVLQCVGLGHKSLNHWHIFAEEALADHFKGQICEIGKFTDLSELKNNDKLYFAFKTRPTHYCRP